MNLSPFLKLAVFLYNQKQSGQKFEYFRKEKSFYRKIKNNFLSFLKELSRTWDDELLDESI